MKMMMPCSTTRRRRTSIEPDYYLPIIPMSLVNGAEGIGIGWSTFIPAYNQEKCRKLEKDVER